MTKSAVVRRALLLTVLVCVLPLPLYGSGSTVVSSDTSMAWIHGGNYLPLYANAGARIEVSAFEIDRVPVTNEDFRTFVKANPRWQRSRIAPAFADAGYLRSWTGDTSYGDERIALRPVTDVSWFAARAYCSTQGKRLPLVREWEYVAAATSGAPDGSSDPAELGRLMRTYSGRSSPAPPIDGSAPNHFGVHHLHDRVWEWVADFNSVLHGDDSRGASGHDRQLYCAAGAIGATDTRNYPAFLRYGFRAGLHGRTTTPNLGFRCARSV